MLHVELQFPTNCLQGIGSINRHTVAQTKWAFNMYGMSGLNTNPPTWHSFVCEVCNIFLHSIMLMENVLACEWQIDFKIFGLGGSSTVSILPSFEVLSHDQHGTERLRTDYLLNVLALHLASTDPVEEVHTVFEQFLH